MGGGKDQVGVSLKCNNKLEQLSSCITWKAKKKGILFYIIVFNLLCLHKTNLNGLFSIDVKCLRVALLQP